jgi:hypothetical protein
VEPTDADPQEAAATMPTTKTTTTTKTTKTTTLPVLSGSGSSTKTTTATTKRAGSAISINSKEEALGAFNSAVQKVTGGKAGFAKSHLVTSRDWDFDQALGNAPAIPGIGEIDPSRILNDALNKGPTTATAQKGSGNSLIRGSSLAMGDMKDVTYTGSAGATWTITMTVKDGETRRKKGGGLTGSAPVDRGPLSLATGGSLSDHMDADKIFALVKDSFSIVGVEPIDISESTTQAKFVASLDAEGRLTELRVTFNQTINLRDIAVLGGLQSFKDGTGSSAVTITYDGFVY